MNGAYFDPEQRGGRAIVRIVAGEGPKQQVLRLEIDTGSDQPIIVSERVAADLCITLESGFATFHLADGSPRDALKGKAVIDWFGERREVEVFGWVGDASDNRGKKNRIDGLAGRRLFGDALVSLNFVDRKIDISRPAPSGGS